jgi:hypothetical protein
VGLISALSDITTSVVSARLESKLETDSKKVCVCTKKLLLFAPMRLIFVLQRADGETNNGKTGAIT